ncbi:MAG: calcium-binding protein [Tepidisphaeraceae bacterium]
MGNQTHRPNSSSSGKGSFQRLDKAVEALETRRLLSISVVSGVLTVDLSSKTNEHTVIVSVDSQTGDYRVEDNGRIHEFPQAGIDSVDVLGPTVSSKLRINATFPTLDSDNAIKGGAGNNTLIGSKGGNTIIFGGEGNNSITARGTSNVVNGGAGNNTLVGGAGNDTLQADGAGDDLIMCTSGNNVAFGGSGNDTLVAGTGNDTLSGKGGNNLIIGGSGNSSLKAGSGGSTILGGTGSSTLVGGAGDDFLAAGETDMLLTAGETLPAASGLDLLEGFNGNDTLIGVAASDTLSGGNGANEFDAPTGATFTDFNAAQGDFQPSNETVAGTAATDITVKLRIKIHGSLVAIPNTAGSVADGTSEAEVTSLSGNSALIQFRSATAKQAFTLGTFFQQWGISFSSSGIGQFVGGPDGTLSMTVNGVPNTDFNNYVVQNDDVIVIKYN